MRHRLTLLKTYHSNKVIQDGTHIVTIKEISDDLGSRNGPWIDQTPQLKIIFENSAGAKISMWINLIGYFTKDDFTGQAPESIEFRQHPTSKELYAVSKAANKRIMHPVKTETCHQIVNRVAECTGLTDEYQLHQLLGRQLKITVYGSRVVRTDRIETTEQISAPTF